MADPIRVGVAINMAQADKLLSDLSLKVHDLRPAWRRIDRDVTERLREQFSSKGAHLGTPWWPLEASTVRRRTERRMASGRARAKAMAAANANLPLQDTRELWASYTKPSSPDSIRIFDMLSYERGTTHTKDGVPVALIHQDGVPGVIPARPVIPEKLPQPVLASWEGMLVQYITQGTLK